MSFVIYANLLRAATDQHMFSTFTPLIFSAIFYASNGHVHIAYIDALFNSVSAITVCGLATVNLSTLTNWQQVILFFLMCIGNPVRILYVSNLSADLDRAVGHRLMGYGVRSEVSRYIFCHLYLTELNLTIYALDIFFRSNSGRWCKPSSRAGSETEQALE